MQPLTRTLYSWLVNITVNHDKRGLMRIIFLSCFLICSCFAARAQTPATPSSASSIPATASTATPAATGAVTSSPVTGSPPAATTSEQKPDPNSIILQYQAALREEAKIYRESLTDSLNQVKWVGGIMVVLGTAIFGLLNWKSAKEIRAQVNERFRAQVDAIVAKKIEAFEANLRPHQAKLEETSRELTALKKVETEVLSRLNRLSERSADMAYLLAYSFTALNESADDREWQNARRDCITQLHVYRRELPHWRRVGILLGRLHKSFGEYAEAVGVLTEVIEFRDKAAMPPDSDHAALLFNRGCYNNVLADEAQSKTLDAERFREAAWKDVNQAVLINPSDLEEARSDKELETLWNGTTRRKEDLGKNTPPKKRNFFQGLMRFFPK